MMESSEEASCQPRCCGGQIREALEPQTAAAEERLSPGAACRRRLGGRNSQMLSSVTWGDRTGELVAGKPTTAVG